eukprot:GEMP01079428.1.p1 GENE.GEMP01079428.1~~GEMP01079428.1.p1  ORF type:complete len:107 (-),score=2.62 GEMP01079428.1:461-781(-)
MVFCGIFVVFSITQNSTPFSVSDITEKKTIAQQEKKRRVSRTKIVPINAGSRVGGKENPLPLTKGVLFFLAHSTPPPHLRDCREGIRLGDPGLLRDCPLGWGEGEV